MKFIDNLTFLNSRVYQTMQKICCLYINKVLSSQLIMNRFP